MILLVVISLEATFVRNFIIDRGVIIIYRNIW